MVSIRAVVLMLSSLCSWWQRPHSGCSARPQLQHCHDLPQTLQVGTNMSKCDPHPLAAASKGTALRLLLGWWWWRASVLGPQLRGTTGTREAASSPGADHVSWNRRSGARATHTPPSGRTRVSRGIRRNRYRSHSSHHVACVVSSVQREYS